MTTDASESKLSLRERKKREAKHAIRAAALRLFARHGYAAVSIEHIVAEANVSRTTFFNYFASKEAVVLEPDSGQAEVWRQLRVSRPDDEPVWHSITSVVLDSVQQGKDWLIVLKQLKATSAGTISTAMHGTHDGLTRDLRAWLDERTPAEQQVSARFQLNVALSAVATAFDEWDIDQPFDILLKAVQHNLDQLGPAFGAPS